VWAGLVIATVFLIALLIFMGDNARAVTIHYLGQPSPGPHGGSTPAQPESGSSAEP
jgi:uncharacterized integral membrane protein